ncbi:MAG: hypothetical protein WKF73_02825 [Nocardioidaceae bacterium]
MGGHGSHLIGSLSQSNCLIVAGSLLRDRRGHDRRRARARQELLMSPSDGSACC